MTLLRGGGQVRLNHHLGKGYKTKQSGCLGYWQGGPASGLAFLRGEQLARLSPSSLEVWPEHEIAQGENVQDPGFAPKQARLLEP